MKEKILTYCNPLSIPNIPRGKDEWYKAEPKMFSHENKPKFVKTPDYRSISDPTVFYYDNKWYMYPSYGMAWVSEDFVTWKHYRTEPYCPKYSPSIIPWKDKFLMTSWFCPLYVADTPLGPFKELGSFILPDNTEYLPCDPGIFIDEDGRIYLYAFDETEDKTLIVGYELDCDEPRRIISPKHIILTLDAENHWWERRGYHKQDDTYGWVEGPHLLKYNGRYYMIYASSDTRDSSYCMAVYYSDKGPLTDFVCQKNNPLTYRIDGLVSGAGHGCVERGPNDTLWAFYTIPTPYTHCYERRIGMDLVAVDENGELYCPHGVTDTPQYQPGMVAECEKNNAPKWFNLTGGCRPEVSSVKEGRDAIYAVDESKITWWQPNDADKTPTLTCDLEAEYIVYASRIFWKEIGLDYKNAVLPAPIKYTVEGYCNGKWSCLIDATQNEEEKNIDYREFVQPQICNKVRIKIVQMPPNLKIGIIDFSIFGERNKR